MLVKKLVGEKCYLSPYSVEYSELFFQWVNDIDVISTMVLANKTISLETEKYFMGQLSKGHNYLIVDKQTDKIIGGCGFFDVDHINRKATVGIIIGDKTHWNKGFGSDALRTLCSLGFNFLNLHNIMLTVYSFNERGIKCYEKVGFKVIGRRRQSFFLNGKTYDEVFMDLLKEDLKVL